MTGRTSHSLDHIVMEANMIPPNDVVADLPAPMDDEPASVRQDIADELADHLACAYRRELLKTADDRTAQQRVLDRFGNPQRIAYQLWFQALWGRIMLQRFTRVWQGLKIVAGVVALFYAIRVAEQQSALHNQLVFLTANNNTMSMQASSNRLLLEQLLARLPAAPQPAGDAGGMSPMGMPGMMGTSDMGMATDGTLPGMDGGMMGEDGTPVAGAPTKHGLKLQLTMQGETEAPAAGCYVSVIEEGGTTLSPYNDHSSAEGMAGMSMMSSGGMGSAPGMAGGMSGGPAFGGSGKHLKNGAFGYLVSPQAQGTIYFAKTVDSRLPPPPFLEPGRYVVTIEFPDGRTGTHRFVVPPQHRAALHEERIVCPPGDQKAYITFHTPVLENTVLKADADLHIVAHVTPQSLRLGKSEWILDRSERQWTIHFDPRTGAPVRYESTEWLNPPTASANVRNQSFDVSDLPADERFLGLSAGNYHVDLSWHRQYQRGTFEKAEFPAGGAVTNGQLVISTETRDVLLDLPPEMLEHLRKFAESNLFAPKEGAAPVEVPADAAKAPKAE